jgi:CDP-2,3-bis-(O-geranylgeranyl)-sn-glycerol synthase
MWEAFWFFLPAGVANMAPVFANRIPILNTWVQPIDGGKTYRGIRLLGDNKTWRGLLFGIFCAVVVALLQYRVFSNAAGVSTFFIIAAGALLGFGALFGDALASFFKRQQKRPPGSSWFPVDQLDYIIGGLVFVFPLVQPRAVDMVYIVVIYFCLHLVTSYIGFLLGLKNKPI